VRTAEKNEIGALIRKKRRNSAKKSKIEQKPFLFWILTAESECGGVKNGLITEASWMCIKKPGT
jgi:hypothetical protein